LNKDGSYRPCGDNHGRARKRSLWHAGAERSRSCGSWTSLARIVFESFAGLGLKASGTSLALADFLRPGRIAQVGLEASKPILDAMAKLTSFDDFFNNFILIVVLGAATAIVILSFFVLAIQLFIALIEFKLTTLAGFALVPFGLFNKTAFMAERVLGNVVSSGIKVLVLAVIVGIGSTLFAGYCQVNLSGPQKPFPHPDVHAAMVTVADV
jgi:type IV secretion system protein TrbL